MGVRWRILRICTRTYFGGSTLHQAESALFAIPLGILAACVWQHVAKAARFSKDVSDEMKFGVMGFFVHVAFHLVFVFLVLPFFAMDISSSSKSYESRLDKSDGHPHFADYLNVNPIEVLKSLRRPNSDERLVFYVQPQAYLQPESQHHFKHERRYMAGKQFSTGDLYKLFKCEQSY